MTRLELLHKIKDRRLKVGITVDNLSKLSNVGAKTIMRFFTGADVKLSTVEKLTQTLGLDLAGNEIVDIQTLKEQRAEKKAFEIISLVQDNMSLEKQGLEQKNIKMLLEETKQQFLTGDYKKNLWKT